MCPIFLHVLPEKSIEQPGRTPLQLALNSPRARGGRQTITKNLMLNLQNPHTSSIMKIVADYDGCFGRRVANTVKVSLTRKTPTSSQDYGAFPEQVLTCVGYSTLFWEVIANAGGQSVAIAFW